jgi:DNA-binding SARP family transcriptional activator
VALGIPCGAVEQSEPIEPVEQSEHIVRNGESPAASPSLFRPRLLQLLSDPKILVGIISAPAGSGKSTVLAQLFDHCDNAVAHRLGPSDTMPGGLVRSLLSAFCPIGESGTLGPNVRSDHGLAEVIELLKERSQSTRLFLILDDVHLLNGSVESKVLEDLVRSMPPNVTVILASRTSPDVDLADLQMTDRVCEISADDLRFRSWEVNDLFASLYGIHLSPADNAHLAHAVDGWAAGLQLFRLATARKTDRERRTTIDTLGRARVSSIRDYLTKHIVDELDPELRRFLVQTSVLGILSQAMCRELLEHDAVMKESLHLIESWLSNIVGNQFFVSFDLRGSLHLHDVLRSHLEAMLAEQLDAEQLRAHYLLAAKTLQVHGHIGEAARALLCANATGEALALLRSDAVAVDANGREPQWARYLPRVLSNEDAHLQLLTAQRLLRSGLLRDAKTMYASLCEKDLPLRLADRARLEYDTLRFWIDNDTNAAHHPKPVTSESPWTSLRRVLEGQALGGSSTGEVSTDYNTGVFACLKDLLCGNVERSVLGLEQAEQPDDDVSTAVMIVTRALSEWFYLGVNPSTALAALRDRADRDGLTLLCRIVRAILLAFPLPHDPAPNDLAAPVIREAAVSGDPWSAAFAHLFVGLGFLMGTSPVLTASEASDHLRISLMAFRDLRAPLLGCWAAAGLAWIDPTIASPMAVLAPTDFSGVPIGRMVDAPRLAKSPQQSDFMLAVRLAGSGPTSQPAPGHAIDLRIFGGDDVGDNFDDSSTAGVGEWVAETVADDAGGQSCDEDLSVSLFGGLEIRKAGIRCDLNGLKPRALSVLRFLALRIPDGASSDDLLDALWPNSAPDSATKSLHVAISQIRTTVVELRDVIVRQGDRYRLHGIKSSDVMSFDAAIRDAETLAAKGDRVGAGRLADEVMAAYRGPLLLGDDSDVFVTERERFMRQHARACELAALGAWELKAFAQCERAARLGLTSDRFNDSLWQLVIDACHQRGASAEELRAKREYESVLRELGISS